MASSRQPGPLGRDLQGSQVDDGTSARVQSPRPGVIGIDEWSAAVSAKAGEHGPVLARRAEDRLIQRIQGGSLGFRIGENEFRLVRADSWPLHDVHYQIVPQPDARQILEQRAAAAGSSQDQKDALFEAVSLLADTGPQVFGTGLLLLERIRLAARPSAPVQSASAVTPSQLAGRRSAVVDEPPPTPAPAPPPQPAPPPEEPPLSFYEVVVLDELESPIAGVPVELTTPAGTAVLVTDGAGLVRVDDVPPGTAAAHIVPGDEIVQALKPLVEQDPRRTPLPDAPDLLVITPRRIDTSVSFPDATTQRIMVVTRTDMVWGSVVDQWGSLMLLSEEDGPARLTSDAATAVLKLSSTGDGPNAVIGLPPSGVDLRDDANLDIVGKAITDRLAPNSRANIDIDALHEALFAGDFAGAVALIGEVADAPPPPPPPPPFPVPSLEGVDFAAELAVLALQGVTDSPQVPEKQV